jgi:hypothetical protein
MAANRIFRFTRMERAFIDKALLASEVLVGLKGRRLSPEGLAHLVAEYSVALLAERRRIFASGMEAK